MITERIRKEFNGMIKGCGCDQDVVRGVCEYLAIENKQGDSGYKPRVDLDSTVGENGKILSDKLGSWIYGGLKGFLGIGIRKKIGYIEEVAETGQ